ncbi:MAG: 16S rRNA (cytosine(967)-C(5))-methyltransferase RsmB [Clostridiales bacterium]|nr:16S rRNA (cytosine(967)-C(5))-methyltransferase RsmB [Clostridiales bacterium]
MRENWSREVTFLILNNIIKEGAYPAIEIRRSLNNTNLKNKDKALVTEIVNGTLRNLIKIDWIIKKFIELRWDKVSSNIKNILRCGVYQIIFLDRVPDSAVCNECVELAKKYENIGASKFVNAVLRNISRGKNDIDKPDKSDIYEYLSVEYSHPLWLVKLWLKDLGIDFTTELLKANNEVPPLTIRVNKLKTTKNELLSILKSCDIITAEGLYNDEAVTIKGVSSLENMESFKKGYFQVQDESSMLVGKVIDPKPGDFIIDVCSAPGGKATHLAEIMSNKGRIISRDIFSHKLRLIQENCKRLGITIIETELFDAVDIDENNLEKADTVLVDAPCSGLGLVRRKPDIRWRKRPEDLDKLPKLQLEILRKASLYVKKSGVLVYCTCTINKKENILVVKEFIKSSNNFELDNIFRFLPENLYAPNKKDGFLELYPNTHKTDGFFIAKMVRKR